MGQRSRADGIPTLRNIVPTSRSNVRPESIDDYLISGQNRRRHAAELQDRLRLRPFGRRPASELANSLPG
jgi:hypothetical protein